MQRRGWILAAVAVLLIGVALYLSQGGEGSGPSPQTPRLAPSASASAGGVDLRGAEGSPGGPSTGSSARRAGPDGGVLAPHVGVRTDFAAPGARTPTGVPEGRGIPRSDPDADQSSGWRLGQARRRLAILESRVTMYQAAVDRLVAEGRDDVAQRQRGVLERVQRRVVEFREQEAELLEAAQADGTMGDVDQGYEEGEQEPGRPVVSGGVAPR